MARRTLSRLAASRTPALEGANSYGTEGSLISGIHWVLRSPLRDLHKRPKASLDTPVVSHQGLRRQDGMEAAFQWKRDTGSDNQVAGTLEDYIYSTGWMLGQALRRRPVPPEVSPNQSLRDERGLAGGIFCLWLHMKEGRNLRAGEDVTGRCPHVQSEMSVNCLTLSGHRSTLVRLCSFH